MKCRRVFLAAVLVPAAWTLCRPAPAAVELKSEPNRVEVLIDGKLFTRYLYLPQLTKPVLFPLHSAGGVAMTRSFPFEKVAGESTDHPHHTGVFFTYDEVNDDGFWNNTTSPPQIKHVKFTEQKSGPEGRLGVLLDWVGKSGKTLLQEERTMVFSSEGTNWIIDFDITLKAQDQPIVFNDTKEGMFAVRVAPFLREKEGTGRYLNSQGEQTEQDTWGKRAKWMRLEGEKDGKHLGIAILYHPRSVNYPTYWHNRAYGLFAANPLGQLVFQKSRQEEHPKPLRLTLQSGQSAFFKFRLIVYEQEQGVPEIEKLFEDWTKD
ncbi:MAG: PmoA family protein [Sedimentisphaerales bacterium]|nr:PmoA family protein [Sedimentisphaerales bacterium]